VHAAGSCTRDVDSTKEPKVSGTVMRTTCMVGQCQVVSLAIMHGLWICVHVLRSDSCIGYGGSILHASMHAAAAALCYAAAHYCLLQLCVALLLLPHAAVATHQTAS
jgi:hypothetical protein